MAYKRSITSSHPSDDSDNSSGDSMFWPSPVWRRDAQMWEDWRRAHQGPPPTPNPNESSHADFNWHEDALYMAGLDEPVGEWVSPEEAEHTHILAVTHAEQLARIQQLKGQLYNNQDNEAVAQSMNDMLAERVT